MLIKKNLSTAIWIFTWNYWKQRIFRENKNNLQFTHVIMYVPDIAQYVQCTYTCLLVQYIQKCQLRIRNRHRRMEREAKANVIAFVWGGRFYSIPCRASCFTSVDLEEKDVFNRFFQISATSWISTVSKTKQ